MLRALILIATALAMTAPAAAQETAATADWSFAIHGGAGTLQRDRMTEQQQADYKAALQIALDAGANVLKDGGTALDAVTAAITILEEIGRAHV